MELMKRFECPACGWSIDVDELWVCILGPDGSSPDPADCRFSYCFHCGCKMKEPDTIEVIERDAKKSASGYWGCDCDCEQCSAKIDGKKPCERYGVGDCLSAQTMDLLLRQRRLFEE